MVESDRELNERRLAEVELSRRTVEEAVADGLAELGLTSRDHAEIEIVSEGKPGFLGIGREMAVVVMRPKPQGGRKRRRRRGRKGGGSSGEAQGASSGGPRQGSAQQESTEPRGGTGDRSGRKTRSGDESGRARSKGDRPKNGREGQGRKSNDRRESKDERTQKQERDSGERGMQSDQTSDGSAANGNGATIHEQAEVAEGFVRGLLDAFGLEGSVVTEIDEAENVLKIVVSGDQTEALVGRKGAIMQSVLELSRTVVQRKTYGAPRMRIDVNGYGERRREALRIYAGRLAEQVLGDGDEVMLEPMNAADRKVVHDAVAEINGVRSFSEGEDPHRAVVIAPEDGGEN